MPEFVFVKSSYSTFQNECPILPLTPTTWTKFTATLH